jgi:hypothetical protein
MESDKFFCQKCVDKINEFNEFFELIQKFHTFNDEDYALIEMDNEYEVLADIEQFQSLFTVPMDEEFLYADVSMGEVESPLADSTDEEAESTDDDESYFDSLAWMYD